MRVDNLLFRPAASTLPQEEWERLVVDLRETFDARGHVTSQGTLRQWTIRRRRNVPVSALRLPRWARTRRRQMEAVAARAARVAQAEGTPDNDSRRAEET